MPESITTEEVRPSIDLRDAPEYVRENAPPSDKLVYLALRELGEATHTEIREVLCLANGTTNAAINRLEDHDCLQRQCRLTETRELVCSLV